jgi:hypothetical protein
MHTHHAFEGRTRIETKTGPPAGKEWDTIALHSKELKWQ